MILVYSDTPLIWTAKFPDDWEEASIPFAGMRELRPRDFGNTYAWAICEGKTDNVPSLPEQIDEWNEFVDRKGGKVLFDKPVGDFTYRFTSVQPVTKDEQTHDYIGDGLLICTDRACSELSRMAGIVKVSYRVDKKEIYEPIAKEILREVRVVPPEQDLRLIL
jgi:hypothetical protein